MSLEIFDLNVKVAMVTGSTRGLGEVAAMALAKAGADVAVYGRNTVDLERGYGKVINMSSVLGKVALPNQLAYASAKGGVDQMTKVMALEEGTRELSPGEVGEIVDSGPIVIPGYWQNQKKQNTPSEMAGFIPAMWVRWMRTAGSMWWIAKRI